MGHVSIGVEVQRNTDGDTPSKAVSAIKNLETLSLDYYLSLRREVLPLLDFIITVPSILLEKEKGNGTSLKNMHTSLRSF